jgi:hypothetical protein
MTCFPSRAPIQCGKFQRLSNSLAISTKSSNLGGLKYRGTSTSHNTVHVSLVKKKKKNLLHSLGLVYKSMRGMMTNSVDRDQWLNVTSESRDRI